MRAPTRPETKAGKCARCGAAYTRHAPAQKYCCEKCAQRPRHKVQVKRKCDKCGAEFKSARLKARFCCKACREGWWKELYIKARTLV